MNEYISVKQAAPILGVSERSLRRKCQNGEILGAKKQRQTWHIPTDYNIRLKGISVPRPRFNTEEMNSIAPPKRDRAIVRLGIIKKAEEYIKQFMRAGGGRTEAIETFCLGRDGISPRTLSRWIERYNYEGPMGLVDMRGGRTYHDTISIAAWEKFKALYLNRRQPSVKQCWNIIRYLNKTGNEGWNIPGLRRMQQLVNDKIPLPARVLHREGENAYNAQCAPYIEIDLYQIGSNSVWIGDHHQFNAWVRHRGKWIRPWITAWMDMRSRFIVGYCISESPNSTTILHAFGNGVREYGPPENVKIDNGRDYASKMWIGKTKQQRRRISVDEDIFRGIYAMLGVSVSFSIPYHPQSKSIERFFDTMDCQYCKALETYCGKDSKRRPEDLENYMKTKSALQYAMSLESFSAKFGEYLNAYHRTGHTGRGMDGESPFVVFDQRTAKRFVSDDVLRLLLKRWQGPITVGKNGIRVNGIVYGKYDNDLIMKQGKKVYVAYDPEDISDVWVHDPDNFQLITIASSNELSYYGENVSESDLREAMRKKARARKAVKNIKEPLSLHNQELVDLAIKAKLDNDAAAIADKAPDIRFGAIQPVNTPLDDQVARNEALRRIKSKCKGKKAVGDEGPTLLNIDLTKLAAPKIQKTKLNLDILEG